MEMPVLFSGKFAFDFLV